VAIQSPTLVLEGLAVERAPIPSPTLHSGIKWGPTGPIAACLKNFHSPQLACLRQPRRSQRFTPVGRKNPCPPRPNGIAPAYGNIQGAEQSYPWGAGVPESKPGNFDFRRWDPSPVNAFPENKSESGVVGQLGNGWEWTSSPFDAVPRISSLRLLSRLLREFLRWQALRNQGRVPRAVRPASCAAPSAMVSTALPIRLRRIPLRFRVRRGMPRAAMQTRPSPSSLTSRFALEVSAASPRPGTKGMPSKYLYDSVGSALFEVICALRNTASREPKNACFNCTPGKSWTTSSPCRCAELGSGTGRKTRLLLEALSRWQSTWYHPIEISPTALAVLRRELRDINSISIVGFEREYLDGLREVAARRTSTEHLLVLSSAVTIGQFRWRRRLGLSSRSASDSSARGLSYARHRHAQARKNIDLRLR